MSIFTKAHDSGGKEKFEFMLIRINQIRCRYVTVGRIFKRFASCVDIQTNTMYTLKKAALNDFVPLDTPWVT